MRVIVDDSVLARPLDLTLLLSICTIRLHGLAASLAGRAGVVESLGELGEPAVALMDALAIRFVSMTDSAPLIWVEDRQASDWPSAHLSIPDAVHLLATPLELLVENERADGHFLRRLARPHQRALFDLALQRGALRLRHGGGLTELKKVVEAFCASPGLEAAERERRARRLRTFVVIDKDADREDATLPSKVSEEVRSLLAEDTHGDPWPIGHHQLRRRHIESYVPSTLLEAWAQKKQATGINHQPTDQSKARVKGLVALRNDPARRACAHSLHMKKGLLQCVPTKVFDPPSQGGRSLTRSDAQNKESAVRQSLEQAITQALSPADWPAPFHQLTPSERADLLEGFGSDLSEVFAAADPRFDSDFAAEFDADGVAPGAEALIDAILERI
jgi:hypothetical protein